MNVTTSVCTEKPQVFPHGTWLIAIYFYWYLTAHWPVTASVCSATDPFEGLNPLVLLAVCQKSLHMPGSDLAWSYLDHG